MNTFDIDVRLYMPISSSEAEQCAERLSSEAKQCSEHEAPTRHRRILSRHILYLLEGHTQIYTRELLFAHVLGCPQLKCC